jgi:hypothetical protein
MLLHELGHVTYLGPEMGSGNPMWLIPNDGGNSSLSQKNTQFIESVCGDAIKGIPK